MRSLQSPELWLVGDAHFCAGLVGEPARPGQGFARMSSALRLRLRAPPLFRANPCPSLTGKRRGSAWRVPPAKQACPRPLPRQAPNPRRVDRERHDGAVRIHPVGSRAASNRLCVLGAIGGLGNHRGISPWFPLALQPSERAMESVEQQCLWRLQRACAHPGRLVGPGGWVEPAGAAEVRPDRCSVDGALVLDRRLAVQASRCHAHPPGPTDRPNARRPGGRRLMRVGVIAEPVASQLASSPEWWTAMGSDHPQNAPESKLSASISGGRPCQACSQSFL